MQEYTDQPKEERQHRWGTKVLALIWGQVLLANFWDLWQIYLGGGVLGGAWRDQLPTDFLRISRGADWLTTQVFLPLFMCPAHSMDSVTLNRRSLAQFSLGRSVTSTH